MGIFSRRKQEPETQTVETEKRGLLQSVSNARRLWIHEPFTGAWQRNKEIEYETSIAYPTLYACVNRIVSDIEKMPFEAREGKLPEVLRAPNHYQTASQFRAAWIMSKLLCGNTYILLSRDSAGRVESLHVLDWRKVTPAVSNSGAVFYQLAADNLNGVIPEKATSITVPAREVIHDRMNCVFHPLVGIPPILAASLAASKNGQILRSTQTMFTAADVGAVGIITAPAGISDKDAEELSAYWKSSFSGSRVAVLGSDLKYQPITQKNSDSQATEQLKYSDEQICQAYGIPPYKIGIGQYPSGRDIDELNLLYYGDALQSHVCAMEELLNIRVANGNLRINQYAAMLIDAGKRADIETKLVNGMIKTPNEARMKFGLDPVEEGNMLWGQLQDYPAAILAQRPERGAAIEPEPDGNTKQFSVDDAFAAFEKGFMNATRI